MNDTGAIIEKPEVLRFESSNKNLLTQYLVLQDGVIMCYAYGHVDLSSIKEAHGHMVRLFDQLKNGGLAPPFDMIIDFNNVSWIDKSSRSYLNKSFSRLFETSLLRHVGIISDNYMVRTMGSLWSKLNPWMNYSFFKSELSAYQEILKKRVNHARKSTESTIADDLKKENIVFYGGIKLMIIRKKEWQFHSRESNLLIALVNSKILYIAISGILTKELADHSCNCINEAYKLLNQEKLALIFDLKQIKYPSMPVRKYWIARHDEIANLWEKRLIISNPMISAIYHVEVLANPQLKNNTELGTALPDALDKLLNLTRDKGTVSTGKAKKEKDKYSSFSKKMLIEEIHKIKSNQKERIGQILESLGKLSWDEEKKPFQSIVPEDDEFFDLMNAVNVVQYDFFEMVHELKELNQNLEEKVEERTSMLNARNSELMQLNEELDHFVYCVSHDLRAPLLSIQGLINLMRMEGGDNNEQYLELVSKNIRRLDLFIHEILQLSRNARLMINSEIIDFQKIIENTFGELVYLSEQGSIHKNIYVEQGAPFFSDAQRISIIFRNLLSNTIKYSVPKQKVPNINIKVRIDKQRALIEISDNGMGIMKEHIGKVFDMFYRATDTNAGSGLGLYIVKQVVGKMEGDIRLESEVGVGTKAIVMLPNLGMTNKADEPAD